MRGLAKPFHARLGEPWLALNRRLTYQVLKWRLRCGGRRVPYEPDPAGMLYVAASSLPYHTSGYTTRTHEVIRALASAGANVYAMTRPGYPWDRKDRQLDPGGQQTVVGDVRYLHSDRPLNNRPVLQYVLQAASVVVDMALRKRVAVIHAASNHVNALPALLAARTLGLPFQYEMRGLWELTRISRVPHYEGSQAYQQGLQLEGLVASHADRLFVISEQLGRFATEQWGVSADHMVLLPNCVDPERFTVADPRSVDPCAIGYAGTLIDYEGLDTLINAVDLLVRIGSPVTVTLIGDGEARTQLETRVRDLGLDDRIHFVGRVSPGVAREMLQRCAVVCIPRKPFKVCRIVPPIKLVEALAMGKPVIVPDLPVFRDEMGDQPAGWFFRAGDAGDLARVIVSAIADVDVLSSLSECAREYAVTQRRWSDFVANAVPATYGRGAYGR